MKQITTSLLAFCAFFALLGTTQGQVFYQQLFDGPGLPTGWTTTDPSGNGVLWERCDDPSTDCHADLGYDLFDGSDKDNGFMVLNSDGAEQLATPHQSRLNSAAIDCSGKSEVYITFEHQIGVYDYDADDNAKLFVSNNGTTWTPYQLFEGVTGSTTANRFSDNPTLTFLDISSVAANQSTVYLRWEWVGNYEYWWTLDKVELTNINPAPANDLTVAGFFYPVSSYATPASQIAVDTFGFSAYITNSGTALQNNVKVYAYVLEYDATSGQLIGVIHTDSVSIPALADGVDSFLMDIPGQFVPDLPVGLYAVAYEVVADAPDAITTDNFDGDFFEVTDLLFAKENGPQSASRPASGGDYAVGNYYRMGDYDETLDKFSALGATICYAVDPPLTPGDVNVEVNLYRINDDVLEDFSNFEDDGSSMTLIATGSLDAPDNAENYDLQDVEIYDFNTAEVGTTLEPNGRYILSAGYANESADAYQATNSNVNHPGISTILYIGGTWGGNYIGDPNPVVRMNLELTVSTDEKPLVETALTVSPNPTSDFVNLKVKFDEPTNATVTLANIDGRVIRTENRKGMLDETVTYQTKDLAAGTYLARIATAKGTRTLKFVVQH